MDPEQHSLGKKKYPYPKSVFFIISTEFCERFSFYGMKTVLSLFLKNILGYSETDATVLYHAFTALCYFTPVLGAILADSFLGKFRTIFYISVVYAIGQVVLTVGAIGDQVIPGLPASALAFSGLFLIAVGTGGIKPCVASFGGEQFRLPEQKGQMDKYFSLFYAAINGGSLISTLLTPFLRQNISCANQETCYPAAFGVPAALMLVAILLFLSGRMLNMYIMRQPEENIIVKTFLLMVHSTRQWLKRRHREAKPSILDYGDDKYDAGFISDVKSLRSVTYMFLPFPIFWALFDQQGSRWTFQATRMNGDVLGWQILPDQMQVANPVLILAFIPIFDYAIYPMLSKLGWLTTPLQRIVMGGILAAVSFFVSGGLELILEPTYPVLPKADMSHVTLYNGLSQDQVCPFDRIHFKSQHSDWDLTLEKVFGSNTHFHEFELPSGEYTMTVANVTCGNQVLHFAPISFSSPPPMVDAEVDQHDAMSILFYRVQHQGRVYASRYREVLRKSDSGMPYVRFLHNVDPVAPEARIELGPVDDQADWSVYLENPLNDTYARKSKGVGRYEIRVVLGDRPVLNQTVNLLLGANYQYLVQYSPGSGVQHILEHKITNENEVHILWLLPQFVVMTAAEIMFSITSLQFSFTQAPPTMKAVMMAIRFLTNAFGNVLNVVVMSSLKGTFTSQAYEFFMFACLMLLDIALFAWMATGYKYVDYTGQEPPSGGAGAVGSEDKDVAS